MGGELSMPDMSACEQSFRKTFDGFENLFSKDETSKDQEIELRYMESGESFKEIDYTVLELQELSFRINGYVFRLYAKKFNFDLINDFLKMIKSIDGAKISGSIAGLYKPPAMRDDDDKPEFFEIKDSKISAEYTNCTSKKFYLIFNEDIEKKDALKEEIKEDIRKKISATKIQKIFRDFRPRKHFIKSNDICNYLSSCTESHNFVGNNNSGDFCLFIEECTSNGTNSNGERKIELDSDDEGIIIGEDNSSKNAGDDNVVVKIDLGCSNQVNEMTTEHKKEVEILRQRIRDNSRKTNNCKKWQKEINDILSKYGLC